MPIGVKWTRNGPNSVRSGDYYIHRRPPPFSGTDSVMFALYRNHRHMGNFLDPDLAKRAADDDAKRRSK